MAKEKLKEITFADQIQFCEDRFGIPSKQTMEVTNAMTETLHLMLKEEVADKNLKNVVIETPYVSYRATLDASSTGIDKDGKEYPIPEHYSVTMGIPRDIHVNLNYSKDLSKVAMNGSDAIAS